MTAAAAGKVRLQKFLSDAGVASRRHAEELILAGHVLVNDRVVDELPAFVNPRSDRVFVDGALVRVQRPEYFILHKPKNVVCTHRDPAGRTRAVDLLPEQVGRLFPVGRLDADSTGLLLMTNDGELAEQITHPRFGIPKTYRAEVRGRVPTDLPEQMRRGVYLAEGKAQATHVEITHAARDESVLMITLREGRNRQVRRMLARLGYPVRALKRVQIGPLSLRGLPVGGARRLAPGEIAALRKALEQAAARAGPPPRKRGRKTRDDGGRRSPGRARTGRASGPPRRQGPSDTKRGPGPSRRIIT